MKMNVEDLPERHQEKIPREKKAVAFCRCWKSSKFPLCDGAHRKHNEEHNDKVGPVVVSVADEE